MARIFITGSADGLGQLAANALIDEGHSVVLHARNEERGQDAMDKVRGAEAVLTADLADMDETKQLASKANDLGRFDAVIHNAAVYQTSTDEIFRVNVLAPYILTCLIEKPRRLIYMSSGMHTGGHARLENLKSESSLITYSDSKLQILMLCKAIARQWPDVYANAVDPGWVPTKMGGPNAPDRMEDGYATQAWLAVTDDDAAKVSGRYFYHMKEAPYNAEADDVQMQNRLMTLCGEITGVSLT